jgi:hypothetical protein
MGNGFELTLGNHLKIKQMTTIGQERTVVYCHNDYER